MWVRCLHYLSYVHGCGAFLHVQNFHTWMGKCVNICMNKVAMGIFGYHWLGTIINTGTRKLREQYKETQRTTILGAGERLSSLRDLQMLSLGSQKRYDEYPAIVEKFITGIRHVDISVGVGQGRTGTNSGRACNLFDEQRNLFPTGEYQLDHHG